MTLWLIMRRPIWERHTEWLLFLQVLARSNLWPSECCKASSCMTQSDAQKHDKSMSGPLKTSCPTTKAIETKNARLKKCLGFIEIGRTPSPTPPRRDMIIAPQMFLGQCTWVSAWHRVLISSANLFLNKRVLVGHPSVVHLDPTWVPCCTTKPIQTAAGLRCCTQRVEFQMSPLFCGDFLHSHASHWNPSPCWKSPALSKLDYKHMKLWIVQNVFKFSYQTLCIQKYVKIKYEDGVNLLQNFTKTSRLLPFFV